MADKTIDCIDCKDPFLFTEAEQEFYASKDLAEPKRCKSCRLAKKARNSQTRPDKDVREMHDAVCIDCGEETQVPFKPIEGRPVYCRNCYSNHKI